MSDLPDICRHGKTPFEKKLLLYLERRSTHKYELRYPDSARHSIDDLPKIKGDVVLIPLYEISLRIFLFTDRSSKIKAKRHLRSVNHDKPKRRKKRRSRRRA